MSDNILSCPDTRKPLRLYTDASGVALGAILIRMDDDGNEKVIAYASRKLQKCELNYLITELECLAVVWAIDHFYCYSHGGKFEVFTDHSALKWLLTTKDSRGRIARWITFLQQFDMIVSYRPGKEQEHVDALSRVT